VAVTATPADLIPADHEPAGRIGDPRNAFGVWSGRTTRHRVSWRSWRRA